MSKVKTSISDIGVVEYRVPNSDSSTLDINVPVNISTSLVISGSTIPSQIRGQFVYTIGGTLSAGTDLAPHVRPSGDFVISSVFIEAKTAPTGSAIIVDVNVNGTTIFSNQANRPQISALALTGTSGNPSTTELSLNDNITIDVDQVGSTNAGADLTVLVRGTLA